MRFFFCYHCCLSVLEYLYPLVSWYFFIHIFVAKFRRKNWKPSRFLLSWNRHDILGIFWRYACLILIIEVCSEFLFFFVACNSSFKLLVLVSVELQHGSDGSQKFKLYSIQWCDLLVLQRGLESNCLQYLLAQIC